MVLRTIAPVRWRRLPGNVLLDDDMAALDTAGLRAYITRQYGVSIPIITTTTSSVVASALNACQKWALSGRTVRARYADGVRHALRLLNQLAVTELIVSTVDPIFLQGMRHARHATPHSGSKRCAAGLIERFEEDTIKLYVGNLSVETNEDQLQSTFGPFGQVESVTIVRDRFSGDSRGFGFVEMPNRTEALAAISGLAGKELHGRTITVNEARPRDDKQRGGGRTNDGRNRGGRRS